MKNILRALDDYFEKIDGAVDEFNSPATREALEAAERELDVDFPDDFHQLYLWHDGEKGVLFLFGSYRIFPLSELRKMHLASRESMHPIEKHVSDDSGVFKNAIANEKWIAFGDNGGNTTLFIDLDPGKAGVYGQILASCDGETKHAFDGIRAFLTDIVERISSGSISWDEEIGCFEETSNEAVDQIKMLKLRESMINAAPNRQQLAVLKAGDETTLVGVLKIDRKFNRHLLHIKGGAVTVIGEVPRMNAGLMGAQPMIKLKVRVGKKPFLGIGAPDYEIVACELVPQK